MVRFPGDGTQDRGIRRQAGLTLVNCRLITARSLKLVRLAARCLERKGSLANSGALAHLCEKDWESVSADRAPEIWLQTTQSIAP